uniref:Rac GTPase-activating protein 1 n=1 Tax=Salmo trutta TaxID=8032 RepID=A0A674EFR9_SALTR
MESTVLNLHNHFQNLCACSDILNEGLEPQFIQMALNFQDCRRKWLQWEEELGACKEVLTKTETERGALEIKLKHARNQVDVEIRRRQRAEAEYEKLERQIQLIRDMLVAESSSSSLHLSEEQRSALAFLNAHSQAAQAAKNNTNLNTSHNIISCDSSFIYVLLQVNESIVTKTTITVPVNGGPVEAVSTMETVSGYWTGSRKRTGETALTSLQYLILDSHVQMLGARKHEFLAKTVIRSEFCVPCGRKTKFGKLYLRCQDCRLVAHPECRDRCTLPCNPISTGSTPIRTREPSTLADYAPSSSPMIPALVVHCVKEIEHRGLHETGLYRVSGEGRTVKELKKSFLRGRTVPALAKVEDIHCVTGLLKDFLRNLPEPLLTFRLNRDFMEAAEIQDNGNSLSMIYQTISELPHPNRDTLAYLSIHLQRVAQCVLDTKMDITNLARVFGPTLVGHAIPDPDPMTILQDTSRQPRVMECLLDLPYEYWSQFTVEQHTHPDNVVKDDANCYNTPDHKVSMLGPVTTPEHQMTKTPSSSSLSQRMKQTFSSTTIFCVDYNIFFSPFVTMNVISKMELYLFI